MSQLLVWLNCFDNSNIVRRFCRTGYYNNKMNYHESRYTRFHDNNQESSTMLTRGTKACMLPRLLTTSSFSGCCNFRTTSWDHDLQMKRLIYHKITIVIRMAQDDKQNERQCALSVIYDKVLFNLCIELQYITHPCICAWGKQKQKYKTINTRHADIMMKACGCYRAESFLIMLSGLLDCKTCRGEA